MAVSRDERRVLVAVALLSAAAPFIALYPYPTTPKSAARLAPVTIAPTPLPSLARVFERPVFGAVEGDAAPADAPVLTGIAGRLNRDAVALVRIADGSARTLAVGESADGWRLESLAIDAAYFARGRERVRVAMQDAPPPAE